MGLFWLIIFITGFYIALKILEYLMSPKYLKERIEFLLKRNDELEKENTRYRDKYGEIIENIKKHYEEEKYKEMEEYKDDMVNVIKEHYEEKFDRWVEIYEEQNLKK